VNPIASKVTFFPFSGGTITNCNALGSKGREAKAGFCGHFLPIAL